MDEPRDGDPVALRPPLWERALDAVPIPRRGTPLRVVFDLLFGVLLPPALILAEGSVGPMDMGGYRLVPFRPYPPVFAFAAIAVLLAWRILRRRIDWIDAFAAGPLFAGAFFALGIGIWMLPFSLLATIIALLGILGFVPFVTALVFAHAGREALAAARPRTGRLPPLAVALCAALVFVGACSAAGRVVRIVELRETAVLTGERPGSPGRAEAILRALHRFPGIAAVPLRDAARRERKERSGDGGRLAAAYERITGRPVPDQD